MSLYNVLVSMPITPEYQRRLRAAVPRAQVSFQRFEELGDTQLAAFDAVVGNPDKETITKLTNIKFLQLISSGVAAEYVTLGRERPDLMLCSASGAYGQAISEHMVAALLMLMKRLHEYRDAMKQAAWESRGSVETPLGKTVLVVGAGSIGTAFAKLMQKLGSKTIGLRRQTGGEMDGFDELHTIDQLDALMPQADVVALSLPETPATKGIMSAARFSLMKEGSYFLNVGRGSAVDQDALVRALESGHLAGASIDVTVPEPLPKDHPLWQQKNLLLTPHISGYYHLQATHDAVVDIAARNLAAWPEGPFISRVDYKTGYRERPTDEGV
ncbi:MAG: D-2-hydroxyacid dehydrogenase [Clostridiales bacterium]|nr:D-2-hydroxyacid dehydrogenase [Clostridiales bacterium]